MEMPKKNRILSLSSIVVVIIVLCSLIFVGLLSYRNGYLDSSERIEEIQSQITILHEEISNITETLEQKVTLIQLDEQVDFLKNQISSVQNQISDLESKTDAMDEVDNIQNQLFTIQDQINDLQTYQIATSENSTLLLGVIEDLGDQVLILQQQLDDFEIEPPVNYQNITYFLGENVSLSQLFDEIRQSVVIIEGLIPQYDIFGRVYYVQVQGSGFVYNFGSQTVILTNNHVVDDTILVNVTLINGQEFSASILGSNPQIDLALLEINEPQVTVKPLEIITSSTLKVGDPLLVVGTPYGLEGSMSEGIVSALNRTIITEDVSIGNIIQTTAPINPGNSGGPMLNYRGQVVGVVTAIVEDSQGIGFAIPSDTVLGFIEQIL